MPRAAHQDRPRLIRMHASVSGVGPPAEPPCSAPASPEPLNRMSPWARHDVGLYVAAAGTSVVGALLVWSATARADGTAYLVRHLLTAAVGMGLALLVSRVGQHRVRLAAPWVYAGSLLLLLAVLTPAGPHGERLAVVDPARRRVHHPARRAGQGGAVPGPGDPARRAGRAGAATGAPRGGPGRRARGAADGADPAAAGPRLGGGGRRRRRGGRHRGRRAEAVGGRAPCCSGSSSWWSPSPPRCSATTSATG